MVSHNFVGLYFQINPRQKRKQAAGLRETCRLFSRKEVRYQKRMV